MISPLAPAQPPRPPVPHTPHGYALMARTTGPHGRLFPAIRPLRRADALTHARMHAMTTPARADDVHAAPPHPRGPGGDGPARGPGRAGGRRGDRAARRRHRVDRRADPARRPRRPAGARLRRRPDRRPRRGGTQSRCRRTHPARVRSGGRRRRRQPGLRRLRDHDRRDAAARRGPGRAGVDQRDAVLRRPLRCARLSVRDDGLGVAHLPRSPRRGPGGPPGRVARPRPRRAGHAVLAARDRTSTPSWRR